MGSLVKFEVAEMPDVLVVGKEIRHNLRALRRGSNPIPAFWERCFQDGTFPALEAQGGQIQSPGYVGVMTNWDKGFRNYSYVVGMLMKAGADVPEGFVGYPLGAAQVATGWLQGKDAADAGANAHDSTQQELEAQGYKWAKAKWCMERYVHPRFTTPDENGNIIMDYCFPVVYIRDKSIEAEDIISLISKADTQENARDFVAFLRGNAFPLTYNPDEYEEDEWSGAIGGVVGDSIGYMSVRPGARSPHTWTIWLNEYGFDAGGLAEDEELKAFVWENVNLCTRCHSDWENCGGGEAVVFGRTFERLCHSPMVFNVPDAQKLGMLKKLLLRIGQKKQ